MSTCNKADSEILSIYKSDIDYINFSVNFFPWEAVHRSLSWILIMRKRKKKIKEFTSLKVLMLYQMVLEVLVNLVFYNFFFFN